MNKQEYQERLTRWIERATSHFDSKRIQKEAKEMFIKANGEEPEE